MVLKLALVEIAQGKNDEAKLLLAEAQGMLDRSDTGLGAGPGGRSARRGRVLEPAARTVGADARTRQNLALAYAFAGNWEQAKVVAAQDVPGDQLDARIQQWMVLAQPARASDQVAAFIGIQPAASDPGQPIRLALTRGDAVRQAAARAGSAMCRRPDVDRDRRCSRFQRRAAPERGRRAGAGTRCSAGRCRDDTRADAAAMPADPASEARPALSPAAVRLSDRCPEACARRRARVPTKGKSRAVVQIGAYSSRDRVAAAWTKVAGQAWLAQALCRRSPPASPARRAPFIAWRSRASTAIATRSTCAHR